MQGDVQSKVHAFKGNQDVPILGTNHFSGVERKPITQYALTAKGKKSLRKHLDALEALIEQAML